jgi:hypothetical protein
VSSFSASFRCGPEKNLIFPSVQKIPVWMRGLTPTPASSSSSPWPLTDCPSSMSHKGVTMQVCFSIMFMLLGMWTRNFIFPICPPAHLVMRADNAYPASSSLPSCLCFHGLDQPLRPRGTKCASASLLQAIFRDVDRKNFIFPSVHLVIPVRTPRVFVCSRCFSPSDQPIPRPHHVTSALLGSEITCICMCCLLHRLTCTLLLSTRASPAFPPLPRFLLLAKNQLTLPCDHLQEHRPLPFDMWYRLQPENPIYSRVYFDKSCH